jgi:hypothetical protein
VNESLNVDVPTPYQEAAVHSLLIIWMRNLSFTVISPDPRHKYPPCFQSTKAVAYEREINKKRIIQFSLDRNTLRLIPVPLPSAGICCEGKGKPGGHFPWFKFSQEHRT